MREGVHKSADSKDGWRGHYQRMLRWQERALRFAKGPLGYSNSDAVDFALAYFVWAHSLREWLIESEVVDKSRLDSLLSARSEWSMCRDLANRSRHYKLKRNPTDENWIMGLRIDVNALLAGAPEHQFWYVLHNGKYSEVPDCVRMISKMWEDVLNDLGLVQFP